MRDKDRLRTALFGAVSPLRFVDVFLFLVSPLAIIMFIFLMIIVADELGQHVQMIRDLDRYGVVVEGEWHPADEGDKYASVWVPTGEMAPWGLPDYEIHLVKVRYYSASRLAGLQEGQPVRVRYVNQLGMEERAVLEDDYPALRRWPGFLTDYLVPILICWGVVILHPDFLYLGLLSKEFSIPVAGR